MKLPIQAEYRPVLEWWPNPNPAGSVWALRDLKRNIQIEAETSAELLEAYYELRAGNA